MEYKQNEINNTAHLLAEPEPKYGFHTISEEEKLKIDMNRSYTEKFHLFTKMLRRNASLNRASTDTSTK